MVPVKGACAASLPRAWLRKVPAGWVRGVLILGLMMRDIRAETWMKLKAESCSHQGNGASGPGNRKGKRRRWDMTAR